MCSSDLILGPDLMFRTRDLVNDLAQSERAIMQAMIDPKRPPGTPTSIDTLERQVNELGARALKVYTYNGNWRLDDEAVAYPMLAEVQRLGLRLVNVHKGLATLFGQNPEYVRATDFPKVVRDWPQLRFCAYHSGYFFPGEHPEGKAGISELIEVVEGMPRKHQKRVYAEIGSTFVASLLFDGPEDAPAVILLAHGAGAPMDSASMGSAAKRWRAPVCASSASSSATWLSGGSQGPTPRRRGQTR